MVNKELLDVYNKIIEKNKLYKEATRIGSTVKRIGIFTFFTTLIIFPIISNFLKWNIAQLFIIGFSLGLFLMILGDQINQRSKAPQILVREKEFLNIIDALKNIEKYLKEDDKTEFEYLKRKSVRIISKVEKHLKEPDFGGYPLWQELTEMVNTELYMLKQNIRNKLIPSIIHGNFDDLMKVCKILERLAKYFLNPTISDLKSLNESFSELKPYPQELEGIGKYLLTFIRNPYLCHIIYLILFILLGYFTYYIGRSVLSISTDTAYIAGVTLFGTLTAGYMAKITIKR